MGALCTIKNKPQHISSTLFLNWGLEGKRAMQEEDDQTISISISIYVEKQNITERKGCCVCMTIPFTKAE